MTTHRLPGWFYVTALIIANAVGVLIGTYFVFQAVSGVHLLQATTPFSVLIGYLIFNSMVFLTFLYDAWESLAPYRVRMTPEKAVWGAFIPFYNFYHIWIAVVGLSNEVNRLRNKREQPQDDFHRKIAIVFVVLWILSSVVFVLLPVFAILMFLNENLVFLFGLLPVFVILALVAQVIFILKISTAINAVAPENHPIGTQKPLIRWSWWLVAALFIIQFVSQLISIALTGPDTSANLTIYLGFTVLNAIAIAAAYWVFMANRKDQGNLIRLGVFALLWMLLNLGIQQIYSLLGRAGIELGFQYLQYVYGFIPIVHALILAILMRFTLHLPLMLLIGAQVLMTSVNMVVFQFVISRNGVGDPTVVADARMISGSISMIFSALIFLVPLYHGTRKARWESWKTSSAAE